VIGLLWIVLAAGPSKPAAEAIPAQPCSAEEVGEWLFVRDHQMGVQPRA
jgi:hypothetical protein